MFEFTRDYLLKEVDSKGTASIRQLELYPRKGLHTKQWELLNHFATELYLFITEQGLPIEQKVLAMNICVKHFLESFNGKINR